MVEMTVTDEIQTLREDLAVAFRAAALHGFHEAIDNHFSASVPGRDLFLINRYGPHWSMIRPTDLLLVDGDGNVHDGSGQYDAAAFTIHRAVHRARPDARVVMHAHMPYATAVATGGTGLLTRLTQASMYFHGDVASLPFAGLATAAEEGERIERLLDRDCRVVLMQNHGVLTIGSSVAHAWHKLYFLERACQVQVLAQSTGAPLHLVDEEVAQHAAGQWRAVEHQIADEFLAAMRQLVADPLVPGRVAVPENATTSKGLQQCLTTSR